MKAILCFAIALHLGMPVLLGEDQATPTVTYGDDRTSTGEVVFRKVSYAVDRSIEGQGVRVYLALTGDLLGVDAKTGETLWHADVSAYWRKVSILEKEIKGGAKAWLVELQPAADSPDQASQREYYDLKTGKKVLIPPTPPAGTPLPPLRKFEPHCGVAHRFHLVVSTQENLDKLKARLAGGWDAVLREDALDQRAPSAPTGRKRVQPQFPPIDFDREILYVFCLGDSFNITGVSIVECYEDEGRILVRTRFGTIQTAGWVLFSRSCAVFVLPRRAGKAYVFEHNVQNYIGGPPVWKEVLRVQNLADARSELESMPGPYRKPPAAIPADFNREIKAFKTDHSGNKQSILAEFSEDCAYEYYSGQDGKEVMHGKYRSFRIVGAKEDILVSGSYVDGRKHGLWSYFPDSRVIGGEQRRYDETYADGILNGPFTVWDEKGAIQLEGSYAAGAADGIWTDYHGNGKKFHEHRYRNGLLAGVQTRWFDNGQKAFEGGFEEGIPVGEHREWHENGKVRWVRNYCLPAYAEAANVPGTGRQSFVTDESFSCDPTTYLEQPDGTWSRYDIEGKLIWQGAFKDGSGTIHEFHTNGRRSYETILRHNQAVAHKAWTPKGLLVFEEELREDGSHYSVEYRMDGSLRKTVLSLPDSWLEGIPIRAKLATVKLYGLAGELFAEGNFLNDAPWNGDCFAPVGYSWKVGRYEKGRLDEKTALRDLPSEKACK